MRVARNVRSIARAEWRPLQPQSEMRKARSEDDIGHHQNDRSSALGMVSCKSIDRRISACFALGHSTLRTSCLANPGACLMISDAKTPAYPT